MAQAYHADCDFNSCDFDPFFLHHNISLCTIPLQRCLAPCNALREGTGIRMRVAAPSDVPIQNTRSAPPLVLSRSTSFSTSFHIHVPRWRLRCFMVERTRTGSFSASQILFLYISTKFLFDLVLHGISPLNASP